MREFRFSYNVFGITSGEEFAAQCREAEDSGYDTVFAADHLGIPAPFPLLVAAAAATRQLRVGTLVLNAAFWNPALLAREIATADILTGGRLEVGLGSGHMKREFDAAGIGWRGPAARAAVLEETITELERQFAAGLPEQRPGRDALQPVQRAGFGGHGPPLIVGGTGDAVLSVAARRAQVVGVAGLYQVKGQPPGTFRLASPAEVDERVKFVTAQAGSRAAAIEWHLLVQAVIATADRRGAAGELTEQTRREFAELGVTDENAVLSVAEILDSPFILLGTPEEMAAQLRRSRERWGFSYITVHGPFRQAFAPVIERLRADG